jgi:hypothetical protein
VSIKSIEMICVPCPKCDDLENKIRYLVKNIETIHKTKIIYEFKITRDLRGISQLSLNPSQTPVLIINGTVEFAGRIDLILLRQRLEALHRS